MATVIACLVLVACIAAIAIEVANLRTLAENAKKEVQYQAKRTARLNRETKKILAAKKARQQEEAIRVAVAVSDEDEFNKRIAAMEQGIKNIDAIQARTQKMMSRRSK